METVLFNPNAGTVKKMGLSTEDLAQRFGKRGVDVHFPPCESDADLLSAVEASGGDVIVCGGDGTVHNLLQLVRQCHALRLGIVPLGTANHLATVLGIPQGLDEAIDVVASGILKPVDLGTVNDVVFSQAAGVGFHASVFAAYGERVDKSAVDAVNAAVATFVEHSPMLVRIVLDGGEPVLEEVVQVTAANTSIYGGQFRIAPDAVVDDGLLDVVIVGSLSKIEMIEYGAAMVTGGHLGMAKTRLVRAKHIEVAVVGEDRMAVHADAAPVGYTPASIDVLPGCLEVIVPRK